LTQAASELWPKRFGGKPKLMASECGAGSKMALQVTIEVHQDPFCHDVQSKTERRDGKG
jgi:hypothetical protein